MHLFNILMVLFCLTTFATPQSVASLPALHVVCQTTDSLRPQTDTLKLSSNKPKERHAVRIGYDIVDGDTIPVYLYNDIYLSSLKSQEEIDRYKRLVRNIKVALPYAKLAAFRLQMMEDNLRMIKSEKAKKKYIKQCEKAIKEEFMNDLKNLTVSQGKLLLKLIHRETGKTTWDILSAYQGNLGPIFWNAMAAMYGASTKDTFDPVVDREIEQIIRKLELE
jgi:hypothetical protein